MIESGVVVAYAPPELEAEVVSHFGAFSNRYAIPLGDLKETWAEYRRMIKLIPPRSVLSKRTDTRDPSDEPYVALAIQIGAAAVWTRDRDYESFEVVTHGVDVVRNLRTYAREKATELTYKLAGGGATLALGGLLVGAGAIFRRLPNSLKLVCAGALLAVAVHEPSRKRLLSTFKTLGAAACEGFAQAAIAVNSAATAARNALDTVPGLDSQGTRPLTLADYATVVCAEAKASLTLDEIATGTIAAGYITDSKDVRPYLRRVLSRDRRFQRLRNRHWVVAS